MLDYNEYREDVLGLVKNISNSESLDKFVEDLKEGLEDDDIEIVQEDGYKAVKFHGIQLNSKKELLSFFEEQESVHKKNYYNLVNALNSSSKKSEFKQNYEKITGTKNQIKIFDGNVLIDNKVYKNKEEILKDFDIGYDFDYIKNFCNYYEFENQGNTIVCDGIACISTDYNYFEQNYRKSYPIEGYLDNGKIRWISVDKNAFKTKVTTNGNILILRSFQSLKYTFYSKVYPTDLGVIHTPYPVAILDNEELCFDYRIEAPVKGDRLK